MESTADSAIVVAMFLAVFWCGLHLSRAQSNDVVYRVKKDYRLTDSLIGSLQTNGILICTHVCSINIECSSINFLHFPNNRGMCELNSKSASDRRLINSPGWSFAYVASIPHVSSVRFTTLGAKNYEGPQSTDGYKGTSLEGQVVLKRGIQVWKVPYTGEYEIIAMGASGGNGTNGTSGGEWRLGGKGAKIQGRFQLKADESLKILVGQQGGVTSFFNERPGGGGGGTFVTTLYNTLLLVAGGGGGGASIMADGDCRNGDPGQSTENGTRYGGTNGSGGKRYDKIEGVNPANLEGTGGGGFYGDGASSSISAFGGTSFVKGGTGGRNNAGASHGGFGGGGAGTQYPGGGGGYSGGGVIGEGRYFAVAGGGGSINKGTAQDNKSGVNLGDGMLVIRFIK